MPTAAAITELHYGASTLHVQSACHVAQVYQPQISQMDEQNMNQIATAVQNHKPNTLQAFHFGGVQLRAITKDGAPWFVAKDVCDALSIQNPARAVAEADLSADEYHTLNVGLRGKPPLAVSESGLYALIMRSRKPEAKAFRKWVTSHVLPAIRKDGAYIVGEEKVATGEMTADEFMARALLIANSKLEQFAAQITQDAPKVGYYVEHVEPDGNMAFRAFSKILCGPGKEAVFRKFLTPHILQRCECPSGGRFYKVSEKYKARGWFVYKPGKQAPMFTPKGRQEITELFRAWQTGKPLASGNH